MDFRTRIGEQSFGVRALALIIKDEKIYLAKSPKNEYYLLGGAILVNELTEDAIIREMKEELNIDIEVKQLAFVVEKSVFFGSHKTLSNWISLLSEPAFWP